MSIVDDMAKLVLRNPNVTAKELAKTLGYAEQKSVYYWLEKAGYKGLKDFREEVLRGAFPLPQSKTDAEVAKDGLRSVPLYSAGGKHGYRASLGDFLRTNLGPESYGVLVPQEASGIFAEAGDVAIVDPDAVQTQGDLVALKIAGAVRLARRYSVPGRAMVYVDASDSKTVLSPDYVAGKVVFILRRSS